MRSRLAVLAWVVVACGGACAERPVARTVDATSVTAPSPVTTTDASVDAAEAAVAPAPLSEAARDAAAIEAARRAYEATNRPSDPFAPPPGLSYMPPLDAELLARVAQLAEHTRVTGPYVGIGAAPSRTWAAWEAVLERAGLDDLLALLAHPSTVVRGYVVDHIVATMPDELPRLYPLLADTAHVVTQNGCTGGGWHFGEMVEHRLCLARESRPGALDLLVRAAADTALPVSVREMALQCAARAGRQEVRGVAMSLRESDDAFVRESVKRALRALDSAARTRRRARGR
jgi:hypothetical protein